MARGIIWVHIGYVVKILGSNLAGAPSGLLAIVWIESRLAVVHQRIWVEGKCLLLMG
jgi:hypothetical protein